MGKQMSDEEDGREREEEREEMERRGGWQVTRMGRDL